jgi:secreted PhoX family phosphatase
VTRAGDRAWARIMAISSKCRQTIWGLVAPVPLKAMGRFNHEAACVDPRTGIVYLTEDRDDSLLYRFLPDAKGELAKGGRLEALALDGISDSRNWSEAAVTRGKAYTPRWVALDNPEAPEDDLRKRGAAKGATLFARGEGIWWGRDELYFACTDGGAAKYGQIYRLRPGVDGAADQLDLFYESTDAAAYNYGDNLCVMPTGHLMVCEDQYTDIVDNHLRGITPAGKAYVFRQKPRADRICRRLFLTRRLDLLRQPDVADNDAGDYGAVGAGEGQLGQLSQVSVCHASQSFGAGRPSVACAPSPFRQSAIRSLCDRA